VLDLSLLAGFLNLDFRLFTGFFYLVSCIPQCGNGSHSKNPAENSGPPIRRRDADLAGTFVTFILTMQGLRSHAARGFYHAVLKSRQLGGCGMGAPGTISLARSDISAAGPPSCYKFEMSKIVEQWLLFEYVGLEFTPLGLSTGASLSHHGSHGIFFASVSDITSNVVAYARSASTLIDSALPLCTNVADSTAEPGRFTSFPGPTTL
jgi:hypothetical protein